MSAFNATKAAVNSMKRCNGGSIVLFSSSVAEHGTPNHEAIASAKAAVHGLMLGTAATYAPKNIRVNCIGPGMVCAIPLPDAPHASHCMRCIHAVWSILCVKFAK